MALLAALGRPAAAGVLLTQSKALSLAFGAAAVDRRTGYLSERQRLAAQEAGHVKIDSSVWSYYVGRSTGGVAGYAYFDTHLVRTMQETVMVALAPDGSVRFVEVLSFLEPDDYLPNQRWLAQLDGKNLRDDLVVHRGLRNQTGASLTAVAVADSVRRVLAVHGVLHDGKPPEKVKSQP